MRGDLVGFGERGEIEHVVDEELGPAPEGHDRLTNVDQLGGVRANGVHAKDRVVVLVDEDLEHAVLVAEELPARNLLVGRDAGFVGDALLGELLLGLADH